VRLLYERRRFCKRTKGWNISGRGPTILVFARSSETRLEDCINSMGNIHGARLMLLLMESVWRLSSPWKQPSGTEVKLFPSRKTVSRKVRLASEGNAPERELENITRDVSLESELRSEGIVPLSDMEARLIDITLFNSSHFTPFQLQKNMLDDQSDGVGLKDFASFDMKVPSSAMAIRRRRMRDKHGNSTCFTFDLNRAIQISLRTQEQIILGKQWSASIHPPSAL